MKTATLTANLAAAPLSVLTLLKRRVSAFLTARIVAYLPTLAAIRPAVRPTSTHCSPGHDLPGRQPDDGAVAADQNRRRVKPCRGRPTPSIPSCAAPSPLHHAWLRPSGCGRAPPSGPVLNSRRFHAPPVVHHRGPLRPWPPCRRIGAGLTFCNVFPSQTAARIGAGAGRRSHDFIARQVAQQLSASAGGDGGEQARGQQGWSRRASAGSGAPTSHPALPRRAR